MIYQAVDEYLQYGVITTTKIKGEAEISFPTITICSTNDKNIKASIIECNQGRTTRDCSLENLSIIIIQGKSCIQLNTGTNNLELFKAIGESYKYGYRIFVYNHFESEIEFSFTNNGYTISYFDIIEKLYPGQETSIILSKTNQIALGPPYSQCFDKKDYRKNICIEDCITKVITNICGCKSSIECGYPNNMSTFCEDVFKNNISTTVFQCRLNCPVECNQVTFPFNRVDVLLNLNQNEFDKFKSNISAKFNTTGISDEQIRKRLTYLKIYMGKLETTEITQSPSMTESSLIANVGGHLGKYFNFFQNR